MEPAQACDCWKNIYKKKKRILEVSHLHIWEENSFDPELVENAQRQLCEREWWNRSEKMKKNEEHLREKERKEKKQKACTTSFVQNEV